ncbi:TatD family hydrolase [bacterium]|nr:TatD family hydrolase [bacterium]MBU1984067.1 TatD family hydrolase [bacterium]
MIDTHSHLYFPDFANDLPEVIERAVQAGVTKIITVATDRATAEECLKIAGRFPGIVSAAIGVHPSDVDEATEADLLWIEAAVGDPLVVAVGEIGLDVYRGETNLAAQEKLFERMLDLAKRVDLPAIVHHRAAGMRTYEIVKASGVERGVFHCFSEGIEYARKILDLGWNISFTGNVTYKNSRLPDLIKELPLEKLLLETDAPFMAPVPYRGKRCEPVHVRETAIKLAEIYGLTLEDVNRFSSRASKCLFFQDEISISE